MSLSKLSPAAGSVIGGGIGAGASIIGGLIGNALDNKTSQENFQKNYNMQKEFAQNSIQWKVQDALKAGISPLAALGAQTYSPSTIQNYGSDSIGRGIASAGAAFQESMQVLAMTNMMSEARKSEAEANKAWLDYRGKELDLLKEQNINFRGLNTDSSRPRHTLHERADGSYVVDVDEQSVEGQNRTENLASKATIFWKDRKPAQIFADKLSKTTGKKYYTHYEALENRWIVSDQKPLPPPKKKDYIPWYMK